MKPSNASDALCAVQEMVDRLVLLKLGHKEAVIPKDCIFPGKCQFLGMRNVPGWRSHVLKG